jgi:hypothetical protein
MVLPPPGWQTAQCCVNSASPDIFSAFTAAIETPTINADNDIVATITDKTFFIFHFLLFMLLIALP